MKNIKVMLFSSFLPQNNFFLLLWDVRHRQECVDWSNSSRARRTWILKRGHPRGARATLGVPGAPSLYVRVNSHCDPRCPWRPSVSLAPLFFAKKHDFFRENLRKAEFFRKKRGNLPKFGVFPRFSEFFREKKRPRHAKSVPWSVRRASHHAKSVTRKERLFGINFVRQKIVGRSIGRSLQKIRYDKGLLTPGPEFLQLL